jgi:hypothetical protein
MTDISNQFDLTRENLQSKHLIQNKYLTPHYKDLSTAIANLIRSQEDALRIFEYVTLKAENLAGLVTNSSEGFESLDPLNDADYEAMQQMIDQNFESWQFIHKVLLTWDIASYEKLEVEQHFARVSKVLQGFSMAIENSCKDDELLLDVLSESKIIYELQEMWKGLQIFYENHSFSKIQEELLQQSQSSPLPSNPAGDQKASIFCQIANWFSRFFWQKEMFT